MRRYVGLLKVPVLLGLGAVSVFLSPASMTRRAGAGNCVACANCNGVACCKGFTRGAVECYTVFNQPGGTCSTVGTCS